jgi:hypothetical protein
VPGARLALVGDGPQRQELEQMFKGMPVKFMVSWGESVGPGWLCRAKLQLAANGAGLCLQCMQGMHRAAGAPGVVISIACNHRHMHDVCDADIKVFYCLTSFGL